MGRLIDADRLKGNITVKDPNNMTSLIEYEINQLKKWIDSQPTVEAIPKDQYEARLKADMVAMLTELQLEIEEMKSYESSDGQDLVMLADIGILFQQKIDKLKGEKQT